MKVLTIDETIKQGAGHYWWENWEVKREGGVAPAKTNGKLKTYVFEGKVYSLESTDQRGIAGGKVSWEVVEVKNQTLIDYILA